MPLSSGGGSVVYVGGEQGPIGPEGPQGIQGPQGTQGPIGPKGDQGLQGIAGADGAAGLDGADGIQGPAGPQGIQGIAGNDGATGPAGPAGPQGNRGPKGDTGARGPQGLQGPAGPVGPQGPVGPKGDQGLQGVQGAQGPAGIDGKSISNVTANASNQLVFLMGDNTTVTSDPIEGLEGGGIPVGTVALFTKSPGTDWLVCDGDFYDPLTYPELADSGLAADEVNPGASQYDGATFQAYLSNTALSGGNDSQVYDFSDDYWLISHTAYTGVLIHKSDHNLSKDWTLTEGGTQKTYADRISFIKSGDPSFVYVVYRADYAGDQTVAKVSTVMSAGSSVNLEVYDKVSTGLTFQNYAKGCFFEGEFVVYHPNYGLAYSADMTTFTTQGSSAFSAINVMKMEVIADKLWVYTNTGLQVFNSLADLKADIYTLPTVTFRVAQDPTNYAYNANKGKVAYIENADTLTLWDPVADTYVQSDPLVDNAGFPAGMESVAAVADGFLVLSYNSASTMRSCLFFVSADTGATSWITDVGVDTGNVSWATGTSLMYDESTQTLSAQVQYGDQSAKYAIAILEEYQNKVPTGEANGNMFPYIKAL